jgi:hypothetical protein
MSTTRLSELRDYALSLRKNLDAGQIDFNEYIKEARRVREEAAPLEAQIAGSGSAGASQIRDFQRQLEEITGLAQVMGNPQDGFNYKPGVILSREYQPQIRESLLPKNLTPEERQEFLSSIPEDIEYGSDRYNLEREGIRQKLQAKGTAATQKTQRAQFLQDLTGALSDYQRGEFESSIPGIAEDANTQGIFRSTGYGEALARKQTDLTRETGNILRMAALEGQEQDINAIGEADRIAREFQTSALSREFSLGDNEADYRRALSLAEATRPQVPEKSNTQKWAEGINTGANVASAAKK